MQNKMKHLTEKNIASLINSGEISDKIMVNGGIRYTVKGRINGVKTSVDLGCLIELGDNGLELFDYKIYAVTEPDEADYKTVDGDYEDAYYEDNERLESSYIDIDLSKEFETVVKEWLYKHVFAAKAA